MLICTILRKGSCPCSECGTCGDVHTAAGYYGTLKDIANLFGR
ncbi:hypothetical protein [uncultured Methanobrevibacter sp.]|nr:hypothetical protein [uncultured Methanobrevibacter sp.]